MKHYARIEDGVVVETFDTNEDITTMFHPQLVWVEAAAEISQAWTYDGANFSAPAPIAPEIPQQVTAAQFGIALIEAGKMDAVQAAADDPETPPEVKWAWERVVMWERGSPALAYLAEKIGITEAEMDSYFIASASVTP